MDFATLGRAPVQAVRISLGGRRVTSRDLQIVEATDELLNLSLGEDDDGSNEGAEEEGRMGPDRGKGGMKPSVSLLRGFEATIPSAEKGKSRRRQARSVDTPKMGLKRLGMSARGMLAEDEERESVASEEDVVIVGRKRGVRPKQKRKGRESLSAMKTLGKEELTRQTEEILRDKENIHVRRSLINNDIAEITHKIETLDALRSKLEKDLLKLQEDELELDDELQGVQERLEFEETARRPPAVPAQAAPTPHIAQSSRRRKGPAFLPSEHDELPPGTLQGHETPITALDFSEPYGTLVSASADDPHPRVWDLLSGTVLGRLSGHIDTVKCLQVEDHVCLTGAADGSVRLWDLRRVGDDEAEEDEWEREGTVLSLSDVAEEEGESEFGEFGEVVRRETNSNGKGKAKAKVAEQEEAGPCVRVLEGHTKAVTALYFEDDCLVTGASDKTLRQWDLKTGQCVMTMDILWAISHPPPSASPAFIAPFSGLAAAAGNFSVPMPPAADGSWDMYTDFVGGVQFWGYALVSGSGDGAVRMWDMRTGQPHRTLMGHTGPVTCLQFDELHVVSGSLDKSVRIWDLRTGGVFETLKYDHAVTAVQFDTRKILAATGENGVKIYNRTSMQHSTLTTNGHIKPMERLRYIDRYLVTGARDATVKIWAL
ncbi:WD40 repeat-like protein [Punctularia strigosozonata HHB-11173 SS5]|uniref:WD40 repeat-like protein n=1 Tax=Punctularia strigosozonata (strain HHB-11173) TaxID=741275 RepID=UPI0004417134|nr:WD40 repeat-like protein [Punctularia strigosozonata HHB-11173 SS5]EIN13432.1 WD40 repeat-like protein [Punctularia strigosozonata HHB-11173 SS5]